MFLLLHRSVVFKIFFPTRSLLVVSRNVNRKGCRMFSDFLSYHQNLPMGSDENEVSESAELLKTVPTQSFVPILGHLGFWWRSQPKSKNVYQATLGPKGVTSQCLQLRNRMKKDSRSYTSSTSTTSGVGVFLTENTSQVTCRMSSFKKFWLETLSLLVF